MQDARNVQVNSAARSTVAFKELANGFRPPLGRRS
jgi:hypothetical protein